MLNRSSFLFMNIKEMRKSLFIVVLCGGFLTDVSAASSSLGVIYVTGDATFDGPLSGYSTLLNDLSTSSMLAVRISSPSRSN
jgi:hypothetical protein